MTNESKPPQEPMPTSEILHQLNPGAAKFVLQLLYAGAFVSEERVVQAVKLAEDYYGK